MDKQEKWDRDYLDLCEFWANKKSKDPSTKVGAVIVRPDNTVASIGYNGFPRNMDDSEALYLDRERKYKRIVHAEINAILTAREPLYGYTLYTWPFITCERCAVQVIQSGIAFVVAPILPEQLTNRWANSIGEALDYYEEAGVEVRMY